MQNTIQDLRYAFRTLRKSPGLVIVAVLSLGLGIGANATLFTMFQAVFLNDATASRPQQVLHAWVGGSNRISYPNLVELRAVRGFSALAGDSPYPINLRSGDQVDKIGGQVVTGNFFDLLGVRAALGRTFTAEEGDPERNPQVCVLSHLTWRRRFAGDPNILGRVLNLNGYPSTIVGVLGQDYRAIHGYGVEPELYFPANKRLQVHLLERSDQSLEMIGRLSDGFNAKQAEAALLSGAKELERLYPKENARFGRAELFPIGGFGKLRHDGFAQSLLLFFGILLAVVGLVLMIACANVAGLLLARGVNRAKEIAVRLALGAGRGRLIQHLLAESVLLAAGGVGFGLLLNLWCSQLLSGIQPPKTEPVQLNLHLEPDWRLAAFMAGAAFVAALLCGLMPALQATRPSLRLALGERAGQSSRRRVTLRNTLVVGQVAGSLLLLVTASLFLRSLMHVASVNPGFDVDHTLTAAIDLDDNRYTDDQKMLFFEQALRRIAAVPGVESASGAFIIPLSGDMWMSDVEITGKAGATKPLVQMNSVGPNYFRTMRIPVLRGRDFTFDDRAGAPQVVLVNQTFADRFFGGEQVVGRRIRTHLDRGVWGSAEIVGVVADSKFRTLGEDPTPVVYRSALQKYIAFPTFHARVSGPPSGMLNAVKQALESMDKNAPIRMHTMHEDIGIAFFPHRIAAVLLGSMGILGLLLATIGLYGAMAYAVNRRIPEIGLRVALGATEGIVLRMVLRDGLSLVAIGVAIGLAASAALTRVLSSFLAVSAADPVSFAGVTAVLVLVGIAASYFPARRATSVDPMVALRYE